MGEDSLEKGSELRLDIDKIRDIARQRAQVVPAVVQDIESGRVMRVAYMTVEALQRTLATRELTVWSPIHRDVREEPGLYVREVRISRTQDSLLLLVTAKKPNVPPSKNFHFDRNVTSEGSLVPVR